MPRSVTNIALHWHGDASARLRVALSRDGRGFGPRRRMLLDETGEGVRSGETYGAVMAARGARLIRVFVWAQGPVLCPNRQESPANDGNTAGVRGAGANAGFRSTVRFRVPLTPNPRPACHAEGRGFESHHPLLRDSAAIGVNRLFLKS